VCVHLFQTIEPVDVFWKCNKGHLSVVHSLPNGDILISNMGDPSGNAKGTLPCDECVQKLAGLAAQCVSGHASPFVSQADLLCWMERLLR